MHAYVHDLYKDIHRLQCISILLGGSSELGLAVACHGLRRRGPRGGHLRRREASIYIYICITLLYIYIYIYQLASRIEIGTAQDTPTPPSDMFFCVS